MNSITGRTEVEVGGEVRSIACDMNAADVLFDKHGEHFTLMLLEKFAGKPVDLPGGKKGRRMEPLRPAFLASILYALLATDREDSKRIESEESLRKAMGFSGLDALQTKVMQCVLVSFGVPGEAFEVPGGAAGGPR